MDKLPYFKISENDFKEQKFKRYRNDDYGDIGKLTRVSQKELVPMFNTW